MVRHDAYGLSPVQKHWRKRVPHMDHVRPDLEAHWHAYSTSYFGEAYRISQ